MLRLPIWIITLGLFNTGLWAQDHAVATSHTVFQATDARGFSTFIHNGTERVSLEGILLNSRALHHNILDFYVR